MPTRKTLEERSESTKSNYIQHFAAREHEILRKVLAGLTNKEIAEQMGLSETRISFIVNSPIFQAKQTSSQEIINSRFNEELATDPVKRKFHANREMAADILIETAKGTLSKTSVHPSLRNYAANDILGYTGYTKKPTEDHSTKIYIDKSMSQDILIAVKELKIDKGLLKDLDAALNAEGVVEEVGPADRDKPQNIGGNGEKKFLDILQRDNEEQLADQGSPPSPV